MSKPLWSMQPSAECVRKQLKQLLECPEVPRGVLRAVLWSPVSQDAEMMIVWEGVYHTITPGVLLLVSVSLFLLLSYCFPQSLFKPSLHLPTSVISSLLWSPWSPFRLCPLSIRRIISSASCPLPVSSSSSRWLFLAESCKHSCLLDASAFTFNTISEFYGLTISTSTQMSDVSLSCKHSKPLVAANTGCGARSLCSSPLQSEHRHTQ